MKKTKLLFICTVVACFALVGTAAAKSSVVVYTSLENEEVVKFPGCHLMRPPTC